MKVRVLSLVCGLVAMIAFGSMAHSQAANGTVTGKVTKDGAAASGVTVALVTPDASGDAKAEAQAAKSSTYTATTDDQGAYKIENVPAGTYDVIANLKGSGRGKGSVTVTAGQTATADVDLKAMKKKGDAGGETGGKKKKGDDNK